MRSIGSATRRKRRSAVARGAMPSPAHPCAWVADASVARAAASTVPGVSDADPVEIVGHADIPGGGRLSLARCGDHFSIQFGADELMGSVAFASEQALAVLARGRSTADADVLIGGLGMGFTLRAALEAWGPSARIVVAELVPGVLAWARGPLASIFDGCLDDRRVTIEAADVHDVIARAEDAFDVILLDVDNGPDGFMRAENDRLYCDWGLRSARSALRPGGVLAIWSAYPDDDFTRQLTANGFVVDAVEIPAPAADHPDRYVIWFCSDAARRSGGASG